MDRPLITVITSIRNGQSHIQETVESIIDQSLNDFEYIIINDGSTDETSNIINTLIRRDRRISLIQNATTIGLTRSLNKGLNAARGKYIARLDAGDISLSNRLEEQNKYLEQHPEIILCGTNCDLIDNNGHSLQLTDRHLVFASADIERVLPQRNCLVHSSIMFRNDHIRYRDKFYYSQDYDLYLNLLSSGKGLANLSEKLVHWRMDPTAISFTNRAKQSRFTSLAKKFYQQRLKSGRDDYESFNPNEILNIPVNGLPAETMIKEKILYHLKNQQYQQAKTVFTQEYKQLPPQKHFQPHLMAMFVNRPFTYRIYRKIKLLLG